MKPENLNITKVERMLLDLLYISMEMPGKLYYINILFPDPMESEDKQEVYALVKNVRQRYSPKHNKIFQEYPGQCKELSTLNEEELKHLSAIIDNLQIAEPSNMVEVETL